MPRVYWVLRTDDGGYLGTPAFYGPVGRFNARRFYNKMDALAHRAKNLTLVKVTVVKTRAKMAALCRARAEANTGLYHRACMDCAEAIECSQP